MPWKSDAERRWGNSPAGIEAMGQAKVDEFNRASKGMNLPERSSKAKSLREHLRKKKHARTS